MFDLGSSIFFILFKSLFCVCVHTRANACTHTFVGILVGPYKGVGFFGAGMTGGCKSHGMDAGN